MAVGGWADGFSNAVLRLLEHLDVPRMGLIGPWSHKYPHLGVPGPAIGFLQEVRRWFDHWLRGEETGVTEEPMLRVWMQDSMPPQYKAYKERPGRWVAEEQWPSARIEERRLAFDETRIREDGARAEGAEPVSVRSPLTVGLSAGKWCSYAAVPDLPGDQREDDGGSLVFDSDPLEESVEIMGVPIVDLELSADRPVAQVAVRLSDRLPDDRVTRVTYGLLNLTHRDGHECPEPLEPGERVKVRVKLNGVAQRFPAGHRIRVSVSSSYWPLVWPSPRPARITVYPQNSALVLPVRPRRAADEDLRAFAEPEGMIQDRRRFVRPSQQNWRIIRDLATDEVRLEAVRHDGHFHMPEIDLEILRRTFEDYRSRADRYGSVHGETLTIRGLRRRDWATRVETHSILTSDPQHFHLHASIDAYEGEKKVFSRIWDHAFDRDLV
jgi:predicted acyl esterase